jgi:hypothetical protein
MTANVRHELMRRPSTGAALPVIAALFCTGQVEMVAQHVQQRRAGIEAQVVALSVDGQAH